MDYFLKQILEENGNIPVYNYMYSNFNHLNGSADLPKKPPRMCSWQNQGKAQMGGQKEVAV